MFFSGLQQNLFSGLIPTQFGRLTDLSALYVVTVDDSSLFSSQFSFQNSNLQSNLLTSPIPTQIFSLSLTALYGFAVVFAVCSLTDCFFPVLCNRICLMGRCRPQLIDCQTMLLNCERNVFATLFRNSPKHSDNCNQINSLA